MSYEIFSLTRATFHDHLVEMLHNMLKSAELSDVTLVSDDMKTFKAHKVVLHASSNLFKILFKENPKEASFIYLKGINSQEIESILQFLYLGQANFNQERSKEFLEAAVSLEIQEIVNKSESCDNESNIISEKPNTENPIHEIDKDTLVEQNLMEEPKRNPMRKMHLSYCVFNNESYKCTLCEKVFSKAGNCHAHIKAVHQGLRYVCEHCQKNFTQKISLQTHVKSVHEGAKYSCNQCNKNFASKASLYSHVKSIHEGIRPICNICGKNYSRNSELKIHIKSIHSNKKVIN